MNARCCGNCTHYSRLFYANGHYALGYCCLHFGSVFETRPACQLHETFCINLTIKREEV